MAEQVNNGGKRSRDSGRDHAILKEAKERFKRCQDWEATARTRFLDDKKFAEADAYNMYQWPEGIQGVRTTQKRPMLTINRARQHNLDILNDARQSRVEIKVRPVRGGATFDSAEMYNGIIKHIEYQSGADSAYQLALKGAVQSGIGWCRLVTDYVGDDSFEQDIFIRPVNDPLSIYLDPDITKFDGSDARFGFVFTDMPKAEFDALYPELKDTTQNTELAPGESWVTSEQVKIAEYFRCVRDENKIYAFTDPQTGQQIVKTEKEIDQELLSLVIDQPETAMRSVVQTKVEHFKIIGDKITEEKVWPGRYVPLARCIGEETVIDGQLDRKGHTRALLDAQRMLNYNFSASVEYGALQSKTPFIAPMQAIEETQEMWNNANVENYSVLPYKHVDEDGNPIPRPERQMPPTGAPVFMQGARDALEQMYLASGQNQADFGQPGNEKSGVAIQQRQRQGDNATYHYLDHQAIMIKFIGKQLIDLIPKVYDTERMVKWRDDVGKETQLKIDPNAEQVHQVEKGEDDSEQAVLNPTIGSYDIQADVGPAYATQRQEAFNAFSQLLAGNKELISVVGDIWMQFADIPGGQEAAKRLKRLVPAQALGDGPPPDLVQAQQQIQQLTAIVDKLSAQIASKEATHALDQEKTAVKAYDSQTQRLAALKDFLQADPQGLLSLIMGVIDEARETSGSIGPAIDSTPYIPPERPAEMAALTPPPPPGAGPPSGSELV